MRISKLELINFKRFTHLVIDKIPGDAKLVLLIGYNGSGKSSVFDGFDYVSKKKFRISTTSGNGNNYSNHIDYYRKDSKVPPVVSITLTDRQKTLILTPDSFTDANDEGFINRFIGRSSIRIIPRMTNTAQVDAIQYDADEPLTFIDNDERFINDVSAYTKQINQTLREPFFQEILTDTRKLFRELVEPLNTSLQRIFETDNKAGISLI